MLGPNFFLQLLSVLATSLAQVFIHELLVCNFATSDSFFHRFVFRIFQLFVLLREKFREEVFLFNM